MLLFTGARCDAPVDMCLVIDNSGSLRDRNPSDGSYDNWALQLGFLTGLVRGFDIGLNSTRVGAVTFSTYAAVAFELNTYGTAEEISQAILSLPYSGQLSNTAAGFRATRTQCFNVANGDRPSVPNLAVIATDGVPFISQNVTANIELRNLSLDESRALRDSGATSVVVGITDVVDHDFLRGISSPPQEEGKNYFYVQNFVVLDSILDTVVQAICAALKGKEPILCLRSLLWI